MKRRLWLLALLMVLLLTAKVWAQGIVIRVAGESLVRGPMLALGDLASITGGDPEQIDRLNRISLGSAAPPGGKLVLTREILGMRLAASGADFTGISWEVPEIVTVITGCQTVAAGRLQETALEAVRRQTLQPGKNNTVTILAADSPADILAPAGRLELKAEIPYGIRYNAPTAVHIQVFADGRLFTTAVLRFNIKKMEQVVVAAHNLDGRRTITADDVVYRQADAGRLAAGYITDINKAIGQVTRRTVAAGTVLADGLLEAPAVVKRGSSVIILARGSRFEVSAPGRALQDGSVGQVIRVQNTGSKRMILARVIDADNVEVFIHTRK